MRTLPIFVEHGKMAHDVMVAKPLKTFEFHYRMIKFLIKEIITAKEYLTHFNLIHAFVFKSLDYQSIESKANRQVT